MRSHNARGLALAILLALAAANASLAQEIYDFLPTDAQNWNVKANWDNPNFGNEIPDAGLFPGEAARVNSGGTAIVNSMVPNVAGITVNNGGVDIQQGGQLTTVDDGVGSGALTIGGGGTVSFSGNGQLAVGGNASNAGTLRLTGPNANFTVAGNFSNLGTLVAEITDANNHSVVGVTGAASLGGTLQVEQLAVANPTFGQSWDLVTAGNVSASVVIDASASSPLPRGLRYDVMTSGGTASLVVDNALILTVDRESGSGQISNPAGAPIEITSYALRSDLGLLSSSGWTSVTQSGAAGDGWRDDTNSAPEHLAELNISSSFSFDVGTSIDLGSPYNGEATHPNDEDVRFEYTTPAGDLLQGIVEYTGPVNDFVLFVDPDSGAGAIGNLSRFLQAPDITAYAIRSASGSVTPATWNSFTDSGDAGDGWRDDTNTSPEHIAELNIDASTRFSRGEGVYLGDIFDSVGGLPDLLFEYATLDGLFQGTVQYGPVPGGLLLPGSGGGLDGDYNGDGKVDAADYVVWRNGGSPDSSQAGYDLWKTNFGAMAGTGAASAAVPEPAGWVIVVVGLAVVALRHPVAAV